MIFLGRIQRGAADRADGRRDGIEIIEARLAKKIRSIFLLTALKEIMTDMTPWRIDDINQIAENIHRTNSQEQLKSKAHHESPEVLRFFRVF